LHNVPGIGAKTVEKLLKTFGSLERVKQTSDADLATAVGKSATAKLRAYFDEDKTQSPLVQIASPVSQSTEEPVSEHIG
jgi:excinuclease ABC subunit C